MGVKLTQRDAYHKSDSTKSVMTERERQKKEMYYVILKGLALTFIRCKQIQPECLFRQKPSNGLRFLKT